MKPKSSYDTSIEVLVSMIADEAWEISNVVFDMMNAMPSEEFEAKIAPLYTGLLDTKMQTYEQRAMASVYFINGDNSSYVSSSLLTDAAILRKSKEEAFGHDILVTIDELIQEAKDDLKRIVLGEPYKAHFHCRKVGGIAALTRLLGLTEVEQAEIRENVRIVIKHSLLYGISLRDDSSSSSTKV